LVYQQNPQQTSVVQQTSDPRKHSLIFSQCEELKTLQNASVKKRVLGSFGYFSTGSNQSTVNRIDYSNDSPTALIRGSVLVSRQYVTSTGNNNFGYIGGGDPADSTVIERIDYSNDNASTARRGSLTIGRPRMAATGNNNFGYFGGGGFPSPPISTIQRLNYSNDSLNALLRSTFNEARDTFTATQLIFLHTLVEVEQPKLQ
jgi:hypothetical protein